MTVSAGTTAFVELVVPDLATRCRIEGLNAVLDATPVSQAAGAVIEAACARGANILPPAVFRDMQRWIRGLVLKSAAETKADIDAWDETHLANLESWRRWTRANPEMARRFGNG